MLQKSSALKVFCAEDWRFLNGKWYMKHAEVAVITTSAWVCFFSKKFSCAEDCAEDFNYQRNYSFTFVCATI